MSEDKTSARKKGNSNNHAITRLVVGESFVQKIGVPVGQRIGEIDGSKTLRWKNGRWESAEGIVDKLRKAAANSSDVLDLPATTSATTEFNVLEFLENTLSNPRFKMMGYMAAAFVVSVALIWAGFKLYAVFGSDEVDLPIAVRTGEPIVANSVRTIETPFVRPAEEVLTQALKDVQPADAAAAGSGAANVASVIGALPPAPSAAAASAQTTIIPPGATTNSAPPLAPDSNAAPVPPAAAPVRKNAAPVTPAPPPNKPDNKPDNKADGKADGKPEAKPPVSGMILDADHSKDAAPAKDAPRVRAAGAGLVAITPDGKIALFTNPKTRLPERFKVGDKLPTGETIKAIDANSGKVTTESKDYILE